MKRQLEDGRVIRSCLQCPYCHNTGGNFYCIYKDAFNVVPLRTASRNIMNSCQLGVTDMELLDVALEPLRED